MSVETADGLIRAGTLAAGAASGAVANTAAAWALVVFGVPLAVVFAAFAGAMVSLTFLPAATLLRTAAVVGSGTLAGAYTSALVAEWWGFTSAAIGGVAFVVGGALQWAVPAFIDRINRR